MGLTKTCSFLFKNVEILKLKWEELIALGQVFKSLGQLDGWSMAISYLMFMMLPVGLSECGPLVG